MKLNSYAFKQNLIYLGLVLFTTLCTVVVFHYTKQELIVFSEAEKSYANKDFQKAISLYTKSMELGMSISDAGPNLANSYVALHQFNEAVMVYQSYLNQNPNDNLARLEYAKVLAWLGLFDEAQKETDKLSPKGSK
jgi:tetratricopeptide (TPR) repeat protein